MSRAFLILANKAVRARAHAWIDIAPDGTRVEFKEAKRSNEQNAMMWASLTDIAHQVKHCGVKLSAEDWKLVFMSALKRELRMVPNLEGTGYVQLGRSSSDLSKAEMADLITLILEYGDRNGVVFSAPQERAA